MPWCRHLQGARARVRAGTCRVHELELQKESREHTFSHILLQVLAPCHEQMRPVGPHVMVGPIGRCKHLWGVSPQGLCRHLSESRIQDNTECDRPAA